MKRFSLIVCTYMRPKTLQKLLDSVLKQTLYPNEILIIDGSSNNLTQEVLEQKRYENLKYLKVEAEDRGLTRQRNFGVKHVHENSEIVCFLDDDIVLEPNYFESLINTYSTRPNALAVGGYITNEVNWEPLSDDNSGNDTFCFDNWQRKEPLRYRLRGVFGLLPNVPPGFFPDFGHGRPISFLPPSKKIYETELFMGGVASYKKEIFENHRFSNYFEGYGLYEDADFCLRLARKGQLYVNTNAKCEHYHEPLGRPDTFKYGKMVVRNGWYIWKTKHPKTTFKSKIKWHAITVLLIKVKSLNIFTTKNRVDAVKETLGRIVGWWSLIFNSPKVER
ncbi:glycosyltransferase family 2 protein [Winogradskyella ursingii]|uniref:glycosyltransferase family 2 protein n=1 Tax=Winogradskyella ursingii TaxID=2686079 RepID=UPI0015CA564D|nr:glycosyltransferase family 2 protein [Winogradskyella ursingii]